MKKQLSAIFFLLIGIVTIVNLDSCKRGSEDPLFSVYSRNERLNGEWLLRSYVFDALDNTETETIFNSTQCDTASIAGVAIIKQIRQESFEDSMLVSTFSNTEDGLGTTRIYDVTFSYYIKFNKSGLYLCRGSYSYYNDIDNAQVNGNFESEANTWYWTTSSLSKSALVLNNFPIIDGSNIDETGLPIRFVPSQTFDVLRLSSEDMKWDYHTNESNSIRQAFEPYIAYYENDTIQNCRKTALTNSLIQTDALWFFNKVPEPE